MAEKRLWYLSPKFKDLTGFRSGRLVAVAPAERTSHWRCLCDPAHGGCGRETVVHIGNLQSGHSRSCGCYCVDSTRERSTKHGCSRRSQRSVEYQAWLKMKTRCYDQKCDAWPYYGPRGIEVCEEWMSDFPAFLAHVGRRPGHGYSLERKNNNGNYEEGNVVWATKKEQANNTRANRRLEFRGRTMTIGEWADEVGLRYGVVLARLKSGWTVERALTEPVKKR